MNEYKIIRGFIRFELNGKIIYAKIISFCYIRSQLEKVETEIVTNLYEFENGEKPITKEKIFMYPNIHDALELVIDGTKPNKYNHQCNNI